MKPETVLAAIKSNSEPISLGYSFKLSSLTQSLNSQGQRVSRAEVALGLDDLTKSGCELTIIDGNDRYRAYEGNLKHDLIEQDFQLWFTTA